ncbi:acylneuraminate cytidylyltransferase [Rhodococcus sp. DMU2021]|uniref:acylneuraminate cytidylyltransferase n=1 Tax=Rhodococcus sp. DMU2021 TaxID=2866997 RepID=UPI001C7DEA21|nr:acylneuraminate cytidylyltransferase [Rhodococcus sp. DMU2021]MBX4171847.1 acylneuraminate cytidylyltransferase [Rhodococcus sp. DMU2021]
MTLPKVVAIIPARGGSKGIPRKNLAKVGGRELVVRAIETCRDAALIHTVVVSTDDQEIAQIARSAGAEVVMRPDFLATDTASSEDALIHVLDTLKHRGETPDITAFVQCTSPFIRAEDLDSAITRLREQSASTVLSVTHSHRFIWRLENGTLVGANHSGLKRQRRQDLEPQYLETGAFYIMQTQGLIESRSRFFGKTIGQEVPEWTSLEIDTPTDLDLARAMATQISTPDPIPARALITDFDGVHTDDTAYLSDEGRETVRVNRSDGMGVARLRESGIPVLILSKEQNKVVSRRAEKLRVDVLQGIDEKLSSLVEWLCEMGIPPGDAAYVGNDINDIECMKYVGWPIAVADARPEVIEVARVVLKAKGGRGAVREAADRVLLSSVSSDAVLPR